MTILFDATRPVKPASRNFGLGITRTHSATTRFVPSQADQQWAAETSPTRDEFYDVVGPSDAVIEEAAREFAMRTALDNGHSGS